MHNKLSKIIVTLLIILIILIAMFSVLRSLFPRKHMDIIEKYCQAYGVDEILILSLIKAESNFNAEAVSHAGAKGIMQITEDTFEFCNKSTKSGEGNIFNPEDNIRAGVWYLSYLTERYNNNIKSAISAYNAGATNVDNWLRDKRYCADGKNLDVIPFGETQRYTDKISRYKRIYEFLY